MKISTRELLYLEDTSKMCQSIVDACNHASNETQDQEMKSFYQSIAQSHQQMIQQSASFINQTNLQ